MDNILTRSSCAAGKSNLITKGVEKNTFEKLLAIQLFFNQPTRCDLLHEHTDGSADLSN
jgi:hypothetical protein